LDWTAEVRVVGISGRPLRPAWLAAGLILGLAGSLVGVGLDAAIAGSVTPTTGTGTPTVKTYVRNNQDQNDTTIDYETIFHDDVVVSGSLGTPTGYVVIRLYANGTCSNTPNEVSNQLLLSGGIVDATSFSFIRPPGKWSFRARYLGNNTYAALIGACEPFTVLKAVPTIKTEVRNAADVHVSAVVINTFVHDYVKVTSAAGTPTGTVTVALYSDLSCGVFMAQSPATPLVNGQLDLTAFKFEFSSPRALSFGVAYSGDSQTRKGTAPCEPFRVKAPSTVSIAIRDAAGNLVTTMPAATPFSETVKVGGQFGTPTGGEINAIWTNGTCSGTPFPKFPVTALVNGAVTYPFSTGAPPGTYAFRAAYSGNTSYFGRTSACTVLTVVKADATIKTTLLDTSGHPITDIPVGGTFRVKATASGAAIAPTGMVQIGFVSGPCPGAIEIDSLKEVALVDGAVDTKLVAPTTAGSYNVAVIYGGDLNYKSSAAPCAPLTVTAAASGQTPGSDATPPPAAGSSGGPGQSVGSAASLAPGESGPVAGQSAPVSPAPAGSQPLGSGPSAGPTAVPGVVSSSDSGIGTALAIGLIALLVVGGAALAIGWRRRRDRETRGT
jgi:hypothetical protein